MSYSNLLLVLQRNILALFFQNKNRKFQMQKRLGALYSLSDFGALIFENNQIKTLFSTLSKLLKANKVIIEEVMHFLKQTVKIY